MDKGTIISISRQYGSGGREVAQILAEKTGFHLYDRQIIDSAAKELGIDNLSDEALKKLEYSEPAPLGFIPFHSFGVEESLSDTSMFIAESKIIRKLAKNGSCIILGRCATLSCATSPSIILSSSVPMTTSAPNVDARNTKARASKRSKPKTGNAPTITSTTRVRLGDSPRNTACPSTHQKRRSTRQPR